MENLFYDLLNWQFGLIFIVFSILTLRWRAVNAGRRKGYSPHSRKALKRNRIKDESCMEEFHEMPIEKVLEAFHCPDHKPEAVALLKTILIERGVSEQEIRNWRFPPDALRVEGFLHQRSYNGKLPCSKRRRHFFYASLVLIPITLGVWSALVYMAQVRNLSSYLIHDRTLGESFRAGIIYGLIFWIILVVMLWPSPLRILLLRPFARQRVSRLLRKFCRRYLGYNGHVFTLQDKYIRPLHPIVKIPINIFLMFISFRLIFITFRSFVKSERSFIKLRRKLSYLYASNFRWIMAPQGFFMIKCSQNWWRRCVEFITASSDVVVMDVSHVGLGAGWELETLKLQELESKTLFIARESHLEHAGIELAKYWPDSIPVIHGYNEKGKLLNPDAFEHSLADIESRAWVSAAAKHNKNYSYFLQRALEMILLCLLSGCFVVSPIANSFKDVTAEEQVLLINIEQMKRFSPGHVVDSNYQGFSKENQPAGIVLQSWYGSDDRELPLFFENSMFCFRNRSFVADQWRDELAQYKSTLSKQGFSFAEQNDSLLWGDEAYAAIIMNRKIPVGYMLIAYKNEKIFNFVFVTTYFDDMQTLYMILLSALERLDKYSPVF